MAVWSTSELTRGRAGHVAHGLVLNAKHCNTVERGRRVRILPVWIEDTERCLVESRHFSSPFNTIRQYEFVGGGNVSMSGM
jgi:hypothetical protein